MRRQPGKASRRWIPTPKLDVALSNGRRVVADQIAALDRDLGRWTVADPVVPRRVILGDAEALDARRRFDARRAARLAAEWVPVVYADTPST